MGFEVQFEYFDKNENGSGYNTEKLNSFKKIVGSKTEDYPVANLASFIIKQLARRDILVNNVDIYEYTKKKVPFKESKSGIAIKGQKFDFENSNLNATVEEDVMDNISTKMQENKIKVVPKVQALRHEIFDPDNPSEIVHRLNRKGIKLTPQKMYPIIEEVLTSTEVKNLLDGNMNSESVYNYKILDDNNKECVVSFAYFRPKVVLSFVGEQHYEGHPVGNFNENMPALRR